MPRRSSTVRYAKRLNNLVERQCSAELARWAGVEDIVQSVFGSFFRRVRQGYYDVPDGDELWKLLLVIALHKIRGKATYHHAAKRDAHRTIGGEGARRRLESRGERRAVRSMTISSWSSMKSWSDCLPRAG